jgi:hypothetical protein
MRNSVISARSLQTTCERRILDEVVHETSQCWSHLSVHLERVEATLTWADGSTVALNLNQCL